MYGASGITGLAESRDERDYGTGRSTGREGLRGERMYGTSGFTRLAESRDERKYKTSGSTGRADSRNEHDHGASGITGRIIRGRRKRRAKQYKETLKYL